VVSVLRQPELFSSAAAFDVLLREFTSGLGWRDVWPILRFVLRSGLRPSMLTRGPEESIITLDPPRHDALRSLVGRGFTPRRVASWRLRIEEIVEGCMQRLRRGEPFDLVRDLAIPVPMEVIAEILGIERERRLEFKRWSDHIVAGVSSRDRRGARAAFLRSMTELGSYVGRIAAERRLRPREDLISVLVDEAHGDVLDGPAMTQFVLLLLVAGNETTTNLIGNAVLALLRHPEQLELAVAEPERLPALVEEALRYDGPIHFIMRRATREVELAGCAIPANARVAVLLASANRDERRFADPDRFDIARDARGHVGFGFGLHFCLGASLARLEATAALRALIPELPTLRAPLREIPLVDSVLVRGPRSLPLERAAGRAA
jgi:cytochrome P450